MSIISREDLLTRSMDQLAEDFKHLNWNYPEVSSPSGPEKILYWPGDPKEDIMICVLKDQDFFEELHRHDFFFFNYAYKNDYEAETEHTDNIIRIREGECYIGQPFAGYGLRQTKEDPAVVIGVLVQKNMFYRDFLPIVSTDPVIFRFFLDPRSNAFSEDFLHFPLDPVSAVRELLEIMIMEYANKRPDTQLMLKPLVSALFLNIARLYRNRLEPENETNSLSDRICRYIAIHPDTVSLNELARRFSYHPNYISNLIKKETGMTFSETVLDMKMNRAAMLLKGTSLSTEDIAYMLGYSDKSNFFKAFRQHFGKSPREYVSKFVQ